MPTREHDCLGEVFRRWDGLAVKVAESLGVELPAYQDKHEVSAKFTDTKTSAYEGDWAQLLKGADGEAAFGLIVEVQLNKDNDKLYTWPLYVAKFRARHKCPAALMVVAPKEKVADWAGTTIQTGHPGHTLTPLVVRPGSVPVIASGEEFARHRGNLGVAVLSAALHSQGERGDEVLKAVLDGTSAIHETDPKLARAYYDNVHSVLAEAIQRRLEGMLETDDRPYSSGLLNAAEARGEAKALLIVLESRGIVMPDEARERINSCKDLGQLRLWLVQAATVNDIDELFN